MTAKIAGRKSESLLQITELHRAPLEREGQYSQASPLVDNVLKFRGLVTQAILLGYTFSASPISVAPNLPRSDKPRELTRSELVPHPMKRSTETRSPEKVDVVIEKQGKDNADVH